MSNNNRNNNRRRGRGNNRSQGGGQLNRIDSRARGNAPQLLEKYKKLAHDASLNGDRVQAEYYLQFADHYFRVIADSRSQKDEQRGPRREFDREGGADDDYFDDEFSTPRQESRRREEPAAEEQSDEAAEGRRGSEASEFEGDEYESADNPFTRPSRNAKPRRGRRERAEEPGEGDEDGGNRLDPAALPGAIGRAEAGAEAEAEADSESEGGGAEAAAKPAPASRRGLKPRSRPRRTNNTDDEELEAVG
ncbi:MAG: DUF4167 domain-containing protein [Novosphingobium sp.]|nr:DUF4167 domain-containing protein [Novosphingobium sp.]MBO9603299.1 DUF4167 domain-containing protein [Novosphingobium sp.]